MREEALLFGKNRSLVGITTDPPEQDKTRNLPGVILLNAGLVHRVGPNRLYVKVARWLAAVGFAVLRFDFSGIGDSKVTRDDLPFEKIALRETQEAMDYMESSRGIERFVLMGICSGARFSYRTACLDPRVVGTVLINGHAHLHGHNDELDSHIRKRTLAHHYVRLALSSSFRAKNWLKGLTGKVDYWEILKSLMTRLQPGSLFQYRRKWRSEVNRVQSSLRQLNARGVRMLHIYCEGDEGLDYIRIMFGDRLKAWQTSGLLRLEVIQGANHTFTMLWSQRYLLRIIGDWAEYFVQDKESK